MPAHPAVLPIEPSRPPREVELSVGERLKKLREEHRYSMRQLAKRASVSPSLISEVERGRVEPSISVLKRLATSLDTTLTYFFSEPRSDSDRVVRSDARRTLRQPSTGTGISFSLLAPDNTEMLEPIYGRYDVGASMGPDPVTHEGEEWGMVLKGRLKVWLGDEIYFLDEGDSIYFPSTIPHRLANVANEPTEYVWVNCPKSF
ncbi:MAG TPA: cupin domain-containing protein [Gemmatimonadaceae bacterium]|nr:cupin domain-containing protein [Gemmatimonadaceae bacterium]